MLLEVLQWPESQAVMDKLEWFPIMDGTFNDTTLGDSAYARILSEQEIIKIAERIQDERTPYRRER